MSAEMSGRELLEDVTGVGGGGSLFENLRVAREHEAVDFHGEPRCHGRGVVDQKELSNLACTQTQRTNQKAAGKGGTGREVTDSTYL